MKRIVSLICMFSIFTCSLSSTVSAANMQPQNDNILSSTYSLLGETVTVQYTLDGNNVAYAKATNGNYVAERIDNIVYLNGVKVATIQSSPSMEPRTGWTPTEKCPLGSKSDYTEFLSSRDVDVNLENTILGLGVGALATIVGALVPPASIATSIAALMIGAVAGSKYEYAKTVYFRETVYGYKGLSQFYRRVDCTYYFDKDHNDYAASGTYYRVWG